MVAKHLLISGRVQGVGYRFYMVEKANELGVTGWVRNRRDGDVEAVLCGDESAVGRMIAWARRGPPSAIVSTVNVTETTGSYGAFDMLPTL